jgi:hypothetical protein
VLKILSHEDPGKEIEEGQEGFSTLSGKRRKGTENIEVQFNCTRYSSYNARPVMGQHHV